MELGARRYWVVLVPLAGLALLGSVACGDSGNDASATIEFRTATPAEQQTATTPAGETATVGGEQPPTGTATREGTPQGETMLTIESTDDDPLAYSTDELTAPSATEITVEFANRSSLPHNIHFFEGEDADAPSLAMTDIATGPDAVERVTFTTPAESGRYYFQCDVHPAQMQGELVVE